MQELVMKGREQRTWQEVLDADEPVAIELFAMNIGDRASEATAPSRCDSVCQLHSHGVKASVVETAATENAVVLK